MKSASEQLQNLVTLTASENEKHKDYLISVYKVRFGAVLKKIRDLIKTNYDSEKTTKTAQKALTKRVKDTLTKEMSSLKKEMYSDVEEFTKNSGKLYGSQIEAVFDPVKDFVSTSFPKNKDLVNGFNNDYLNFEKGSHTVESLWAVFYTSLSARIEEAIQQAYSLEMEEGDFEDNLFGVTGSTNISKNHLSSVIAVLVAHGYNTALKYGNLANEAVISGYVWNSILDSKTSDICIFLDGKTWYYGHPEMGTLPYEIYAPAHHGCRSDTIPITKSYTELGLDPDTLTTDQKTLLSGETPKVETYSEFFEKQPSSIKKQILGPTRYNLYTENNLTVDKFYTRDGRKYSLDELMKKGYTLSGDYLRYVRK